MKISKLNVECQYQWISFIWLIILISLKWPNSAVISIQNCHQLIKMNHIDCVIRWWDFNKQFHCRHAMWISCSFYSSSEDSAEWTEHYFSGSIHLSTSSEIRSFPSSNIPFRSTNFFGHRCIIVNRYCILFIENAAHIQ